METAWTKAEEREMLRDWGFPSGTYPLAPASLPAWRRVSRSRPQNSTPHGRARIICTSSAAPKCGRASRKAGFASRGLPRPRAHRGRARHRRRRRERARRSAAAARRCARTAPRARAGARHRERLSARAPLSARQHERPALIRTPTPTPAQPHDAKGRRETADGFTAPPSSHAMRVRTPEGPHP